MRITRVPRWTQWAFPGMEWRTSNGSVLPTFDDGPHPEITPWVLDQLRQHQCKGVFFLVGENALRFPHIVKAIVEEGHSIGNHSMTHLNGLRSSTQTYLADVDAAAAHTSRELFRPPYGKLKPGQYAALKTRGYRIMMWDVLSYDFDRSAKPEDCMRILNRNTCPGAIVVFHDSEKAWPRLKHILPDWLNHQNKYLNRP